jgi:TPR repeat protein
MRILMALLLLGLVGCASQNQHVLHQAKALFAQKRYAQALPSLEKLAKSGNAEAQYATGYMYFYGRGVYPNPAIGQLWIRRAAKQGYKPAQQALLILETKKQGNTQPLF